MEGIFKIVDPWKLSGKHDILVDDVVTTGATLDACATAIHNVEGVRVSIVSLAVALKAFI